MAELTKGSVQITTVGIPRFSRDMASCTLHDVQDPQSASASMTASRGAGGIAEGIPESVESETIPKFFPDALWFVHVGGPAGLFSAVIGGWVRGAGGTQPTTKEIVR